MRAFWIVLAIALIIAPSSQGPASLAVTLTAGRTEMLPSSSRDLSALELRQRVDVGGYKLYVDCVGTGSPVVILSADYIETWHAVQSEVGGFTRTCSFDRPGIGMSDSGPLPTSSGEMASQVHAMLQHARIPGPYVLVGFAFDGATMRLYASRYRDEVAGLVLVDAFHQDLLGREGLPISSDLDIARSQAQLRASGRLGAMPLVVLSHGIRYSYPETIEKVWSRYQRKLARLSSNSIHVLAEHSDADIMFNQPRLVAAAIFQVIESTRSQTHGLQTCGFWLQVYGGRCLSD